MSMRATIRISLICKVFANNIAISSYNHDGGSPHGQEGKALGQERQEKMKQLIS